MGQALYRKHRPKKLSEVVGQEHVTTTLNNAMKSGRIAHAYLFTGPRGVGKTSIARILAHELNDLPYTDESIHLDIIEIDAASNRRIDEIRDLRDKVHIAPTSAKYKVYIIDEVHMLTKEAFNALLKTLEEPPAHVIFILATTESHKLPETIISRTQRFTFKPVEQKKVIEHLKSIAKEEKINISDEALELVAAHGEGSFRDSISLLDQAGNMHEKVTLEHVQNMLGIAPSELIDQIIESIRSGSTEDLLEILDSLPIQGFQAVNVAKQLSTALRSDLRSNKLRLPAADTLKLIEELINVASSNDPELLLSLTLVGVQLKVNPQTENMVAPEPRVVAKPAPIPATSPIEIPDPEPVVEKLSPAPEKQPKLAPVKNIDTLDEKTWEAILGAIKEENHSLYTAVRMAKPAVSGTRELTLYFQFKLHQKKVDESKNKKIIADAVGEVAGGSWRILPEVGIPDNLSSPMSAPMPDDEPLPEPPPDLETSESGEQSEVNSILDIFGGGEVLET